LFKPAPMREVDLLVLKEDVERLTRRVHEEGLIQLSEFPPGDSLTRNDVGKAKEHVTGLRVRADRMIELLEETVETRAPKRSLVERLSSLIAPSVSKGPAFVESPTAEETVRRCKERIEALSPRLDRLGEELKESLDRRTNLEDELHTIRELLPIDAPLKLFRASTMTVTFFFHISPERVEPFTRSVRQAVDPVHVRVVSGTTTILMMVMALVEERDKLLGQIHRFEGELLEIPRYEGTPAETESIILKSLDETDKAIEGARKGIDQMTDHLEELKAMRETLGIEERRLDALSLSAGTENVAVLRGWVPERELPRLESVVSDSTEGKYSLKASEAGEGESIGVPILLQNRRPFNSFEWITKMYGMPNYREVDPTPLIVPTFVVFFGTCLTDAGYGLVLALVSFFLLRKMWGKDVGLALTFCGLATIFMGWLVGGWFGNILYSGSYGYGPMIPFFKAAWADPLKGKGAVSLLSLSLVMGIAHLLLGHATAVMAAARKGRLMQGLVTHIGWGLTLFFGSIFVLWYLKMTEASKAWQTASTWGLSIGVVMGIVGYVWERSGSARAAGPAQFLYDILGHIADVISYSRLLALGISTGVNAFLIDLIIFKFAWPRFAPGSGPLTLLISVLLAVVLSIAFVFLHLVNMGLNSLSGFVHTMRLHFAEYFGKFYEGGGDEFRPFRAERVLTAPNRSAGEG